MKVVAITLADIVMPLWIISFALFVSVGYVLTLLMPMRIENWAALLLFAIILPLVCLVARAWSKHNQGDYCDVDFAWRMILPMAIPILVLAPGLFGIVSSPTMQVMNHPDIHFGYIYQLIYDSTPVENVFLAGFPANYYWLWHAYIAAFVKLTSFQASHVATYLNIISILLSLLWIAQALVKLRLGKQRTFSLGLLVMFVYASVNLTGTLSLIAAAMEGLPLLEDTRILLLEGASRYLHNSLTKVVNINTTNLGIAAFAGVFYICLRILDGKIDRLSLILISAWGIIGLACMQIATLYIVVVLLGGLVTTGGFILMRQSNRIGAMLTYWQSLQRRIPTRFMVIFLFVSLVLSLPLLKYGSDLSYNLQPSFGFELLYPNNIGMIIGALILLLPLYFANFVVLKSRNQNLQIFVQLSASLGLLLALSFVLFYDQNQYKGIYSLSILVAISALLALQRFHNSANRFSTVAVKFIVVVFFVLAFSRMAFIGDFLLERTRRESIAAFDYEDNHIIHLTDNANRYAAYYWIRDNSPPDAVIIIPLDSFMYANVLFERQLYVKRAQYNFTENLSAYHQRVRQLQRFYRNDMSPEQLFYMYRNVARHFSDWPIYAVVKDSEVSPEVMAGRDAELVFEHQGDGANVYRLYPSTDPPQES